MNERKNGKKETEWPKWNRISNVIIEDIAWQSTAKPMNSYIIEIRSFISHFQQRLSMATDKFALHSHFIIKYFLFWIFLPLAHTHTAVDSECISWNLALFFMVSHFVPFKSNLFARGALEQFSAYLSRWLHIVLHISRSSSVSCLVWTAFCFIQHTFLFLFWFCVCVAFYSHMTNEYLLRLLFSVQRNLRCQGTLCGKAIFRCHTKD